MRSPCCSGPLERERTGLRVSPPRLGGLVSLGRAGFLPAGLGGQPVRAGCTGRGPECALILFLELDCPFSLDR